MELYLILLFSGLISGILTILFGFGGGFIVVPLVYATIRLHATADSLAYSMAFKSAVATSLLLMILNSGLATYQQYRRGLIQKQYLFPIAYWIGAGAILGTFISLHTPPVLLKWAFISYLCMTILDCLVRQLRKPKPHHSSTRLLNTKEQSLGGFLIGSVASALGVGGSVMTVPLFRRCGLQMSTSVALANPLSMPVALAGCFTFVMSQIIQTQNLGEYFIGYFYYPALICLIIGGVLGMKIAVLWSGILSDQIHEWGYITLLIIVMVSIFIA
ncbi:MULTISPECIES: sulfite exporter TauE/SafE family protein [Acinetobacter]|uniref:Probable membrane transporter protein n=1 Tax=Acinetobacter corruptisaponis TaxID=3045147 RepID=A0ABY8S421_9GAMM|nr:sulfite exporter TauE/SafE family protein [Acinetobacter sp. KCTC 92772]WHP06478.1 sulfite exporter TauE/SafE family protein [Acinetobacter sp. KCTC 92772]